MKVPFKPGTLIYPLPAVMVSCGDAPENYNILTIAWTGTICSDPPMCYISVRRERHSYDIIRRCGEFVINLTTEELARATDWCGVRSGRDWNKFKEMHLTPEKGQVVKAPLIAESPLNIECRVTEVKPRRGGGSGCRREPDRQRYGGVPAEPRQPAGLLARKILRAGRKDRRIRIQCEEKQKQDKITVRAMPDIT